MPLHYICKGSERSVPRLRGDSRQQTAPNILLLDSASQYKPDLPAGSAFDPLLFENVS
jgi:hypothetical protein